MRGVRKSCRDDGWRVGVIEKGRRACLKKGSVGWDFRTNGMSSLFGQSEIEVIRREDMNDGVLFWRIYPATALDSKSA